MHDVVCNTDAKISLQSEQTKSYADALKEIKETTTSTNVKLNEQKPTYVSKLRNEILGADRFPDLGTRSPSKRRRESVPDMPKNQNQYKHRALTQTTPTTTQHGLGEKVDMVASVGAKLNSQYAKLTKSIYISRIQPTVKIDDIKNYIKLNVSELNDDDFSLRLLVKKGADVSSFSYVSYRLACTKQLYDTSMNSSFWPSHVMIGEFVETPRKRTNVGDFVNPPQSA